MLVPSKNLEFLSFDTVNQIEAGRTCQRFSSPPSLPILLQLLSIIKVELGIAHLIPEIQRNMCNRSVVVLSCKNRGSLLSPSCPHKRRLEQIWRPLLCDLSWVKHAFLVTSQTKPDTFSGIFTIQTCFQGQHTFSFSVPLWFNFKYADLTETAPL